MMQGTAEWGKLHGEGRGHVGWPSLGESVQVIITLSGCSSWLYSLMLKKTVCGFVSVFLVQCIMLVNLTVSTFIVCHLGLGIFCFHSTDL